MMLKKLLVNSKWIGLALVIIIPLIANQLFLDKRSYKAYSTNFENSVEILLIILIAIIGIFGLKKLDSQWPLNIWKAIYAISIAILTIAALVEAFIYHYSYKGQYRFTSIKQMLFSPIIYILLLIIEVKFKKKENA